MSHSITRRCILIIFLVVISISLADCISAQTPSAYLEIEEDFIWVETSPGNNGTGTFHGNLILNDSGIQSDPRNLNAYLYGAFDGYTYNIKPDQFLLSPDDVNIPQPFTVDVTVPGNLSANEEYVITVYGQISKPPDLVSHMIPYVEGVFHVIPIMKPLIWSEEETSKEGVPGEGFMITLMIKNDGNCDSDVVIDVIDDEKLIENGWDIIPSLKSLILREEKTSAIDIHCKISPDAIPGEYHFDVGVTMEPQNGYDVKESDSITITIIVSDKKHNTIGDGIDDIISEEDEKGTIPGFESITLIVLLAVISVAYRHKFWK